MFRENSNLKFLNFESKDLPFALFYSLQLSFSIVSFFFVLMILSLSLSFLSLSIISSMLVISLHLINVLIGIIMFISLLYKRKLSNAIDIKDHL